METSRARSFVAAAILCAVGFAAHALGQGCAPTWTTVNRVGPSARIYSAMAYDEAHARAVLFGGMQSGAIMSGETWTWYGGTWAIRANTGPSPRAGHAMVYDSARARVVLFGGANSGYYTTPSPSDLSPGETWEWDGFAWTRVVVAGPAPRLEAAMAYDSARHVTVLFGGQQAGSPSNETWEWDGTTWTPRYIAAPPAPRYQHAMCYDSARGRIVMYGGRDLSNNFFSDTWEYDGTNWMLVATFGPSPRPAAAMAYDANRGLTILFGGYGGDITSSYTDTWEWDGFGWAQRDFIGPNAYPAFGDPYSGVGSPLLLFGSALAFESASARILAFGGAHISYYTQQGPYLPPFHGTAELLAGAGPTISTIAGAQDLSPGERATFFVITEEAASTVTYQWRRNGINISCGGRTTGCNGPVLIIDPVQEGDTGTYDVVVTNACDFTVSPTTALTVEPHCGSADFNGDGDIGTDADIEAFFRVLGGGHC
jgi:hypothetical protein